MIKKAGVIGAGNMGAAIAEVLAFNGLDVVIKDINLNVTAKGVERIRRILEQNAGYQEKRAEKEISRIEKLGVKLTEEQKNVIKKTLAPTFPTSEVETTLSHITQTDKWSDFNGCDIVIEAVFENEAIKKETFKSVSEFLDDEAILASNTSSLSITSLAVNAKHPENVIVTHFFNPPYTLPLVEIVPALQTSDKTVEETYAFISGLKNHRGSMVPIKVKEVPGFVVNRILVPVMNEAIQILDEGIASKEDIDKAMKFGAGFPMGPLELSDMVGLDIVLNVQNILMNDYGDQKYRPSVLLKKLVDAGRLGKKVGIGFYDYRK